jgi:hypothetical protein
MSMPKRKVNSSPSSLVSMCFFEVEESALLSTEQMGRKYLFPLPFPQARPAREKRKRDLGRQYLGPELPG